MPHGKRRFVLFGELRDGRPPGQLVIETGRHLRAERGQLCLIRRDEISIPNPRRVHGEGGYCRGQCISVSRHVPPTWGVAPGVLVTEGCLN